MTTSPNAHVSMTIRNMAAAPNGVSTQDVSDGLGMTRSNASGRMSKLFSAGFLFKARHRNEPEVRYFCSQESATAWFRAMNEKPRPPVIKKPRKPRVYKPNPLKAKKAIDDGGVVKIASRKLQGEAFTPPGLKPTIGPGGADMRYVADTSHPKFEPVFSSLGIGRYVQP